MTSTEVCIFGPFDPALGTGFHGSTALLIITQYLLIIPIFLASLLLGKAIEGSRRVFVFVIIALTLVSNVADIIFHSTFVCQPPGGPVLLNTNTHKYLFWDFWYCALFYLSNVYNYTLFLYNYKLLETYTELKLKKDTLALSIQVKAQGPIKVKENREMKELEEKSKKELEDKSKKTAKRLRLF